MSNDTKLLVELLCPRCTARLEIGPFRIPGLYLCPDCDSNWSEQELQDAAAIDALDASRADEIAGDQGDDQAGV